MSDTLPDLELSDVGVMAYWNIEDEGYEADNIDWDELTTALDSYIIYDNGYTGILADYANNGRDVHVRVKTDGWIVVYFSSELHDESGTGIWDLHNWYYPTRGPEPIENDVTLYDAIQDVTLELNEEPSVFFSDTHFYCPVHPSATAETYVRIEDNRGLRASIEFTISDEVTILEVYNTMMTQGYDTNNEYGEVWWGSQDESQTYYEVIADTSDTDDEHKLYLTHVVTDDMVTDHTYFGQANHTGDYDWGSQDGKIGWYIWW